MLAAQAREVLDREVEAQAETLYDVCHNIAKWEEHTDPTEGGSGPRKRLLVHRKGATRAFPAGHPDLPPEYAEVGQPVIVPGDMGRASFVLAAQPGAMRTTFGSSCHGAGRRLSRTAAKKQFGGGRLIQDLARQGILVRATSETVAAEEAPLAYKDVSAVVASAQAAGLAAPVARLRPLGVVKG